MSTRRFLKAAYLGSMYLLEEGCPGHITKTKRRPKRTPPPHPPPTTGPTYTQA